MAGEQPGDDAAGGEQSVRERILASLAKLGTFSSGCSRDRLAEICQAGEGEVAQEIIGLIKEGLVGQRGPMSKPMFFLLLKAKTKVEAAPETHPCAKCSRILSSEADLRDHIKKDHPGPEPDRPEDAPRAEANPAQDLREKELEARFKELWALKLSHAEIATRLGVDRQTEENIAARLRYRGEIEPKSETRQRSAELKAAEKTQRGAFKAKCGDVLETARGQHIHEKLCRDCRGITRNEEAIRKSESYEDPYKKARPATAELPTELHTEVHTAEAAIEIIPEPSAAAPQAQNGPEIDIPQPQDGHDVATEQPSAPLKDLRAAFERAFPPEHSPGNDESSGSTPSGPQDPVPDGMTPGITNGINNGVHGGPEKEPAKPIEKEGSGRPLLDFLSHIEDACEFLQEAGLEVQKEVNLDTTPSGAKCKAVLTIKAGAQDDDQEAG
jgi:hypothetical protein